MDDASLILSEYLRASPSSESFVHSDIDITFSSLAVNIANGAQVWKGFFQSVRPTMGGLVVNLDVAFSAL